MSNYYAKKRKQRTQKKNNKITSKKLLKLMKGTESQVDEAQAIT